MKTSNDIVSGWISLHRRIREHWIWQDPVKLKWWIDILLTVNHEDKKVNIGMRLIECKRGQTVMSLRNWADRWKVSRDSTRNFLELLKKDGMITTENLTNTTRITVCNYEDYQGGLRTDQTLSKRKANAKQTPADTNNNDNNDNNDNNSIVNKSTRSIPPTIEEIKDYCVKRNNSVDANNFFNFYESKGWMVGKTKMKDWKASVRTWENRENNKYSSNNGNGKTAITTSRARQKLD